MKNLATYIIESKGQRLSLRKTNRPYDPEHDVLIELKNTREDRSKELKVKHAKEIHKIAFDNLINVIKTIQKNKSEIKKYFDFVYFDNYGNKDIDIDLLTCDINKFSYDFNGGISILDPDHDSNQFESIILYDNKPYKNCKIRSDQKNVSDVWLRYCALIFIYNDNINEEIAKMAVKQFNRGENNAWADDEDIRINVYDEQSIKKLIKCIGDIVDRW